MDKVKIYSSEVRIDKFGRYSLTDMNKPYGRNLTWFFASDVFKDYVAGLLQQMNENRTLISKSYSCKPLSINSLYEIKKGTGVNAGIWIHEDLVVFCARWLNIKFAIACDQFIKDALNWNSKRLLIKDSNKSMNAAVKLNLIDTGILSPNGQKFIFMNIAKAVCKALTGMTPRQYENKYNKPWRDNADKETLETIKRVEETVERNIMKGRIKSAKDAVPFIEKQTELLL